MATAANYRRQNLRGRSFAGEELNGADFTASDLRGADFSHASLVGANFTDARMGIRPIAAIVLLAAAIVVSIVAGLAIGAFAETTREQAQSSDWRDVFASALLIFVAVSFLAILMIKGASKALRSFLILLGAIVLLDFVVVFVLAGEIRFRNAVSLLALIILFVPAAISGILGRLVGGTFGAWAIALVAVIGGLAAGRANGGVSAMVVSVILVLISKRALKGDARDGPMRYIGLRIATNRGTKFADADLTRANFTGTNPIHSDLHSATTTGIIWEPGHVGYTPDNPSDEIGGST